MEWHGSTQAHDTSYEELIRDLARFIGFRLSKGTIVQFYCAGQKEYALVHCQGFRGDLWVPCVYPYISNQFLLMLRAGCEGYNRAVQQIEQFLEQRCDISVKTKRLRASKVLPCDVRQSLGLTEDIRVHWAEPERLLRGTLALPDQKRRAVRDKWQRMVDACVWVHDKTGEETKEVTKQAKVGFQAQLDVTIGENSLDHLLFGPWSLWRRETKPLAGAPSWMWCRHLPPWPVSEREGLVDALQQTNITPNTLLFLVADYAISERTQQKAMLQGVPIFSSHACVGYNTTKKQTRASKKHNKREERALKRAEAKKKRN